MADPRPVSDVLSDQELRRERPFGKNSENGDERSLEQAEQILAEGRREAERRRARQIGADPDCPICGGFGYIRYDLPLDHPQFGRIHDCECRTEAVLERLERISGLMPHERQLSFDGLTGQEVTQIVGMAQAFVLNGRGWFTLWGGPGNAKTAILIASTNLFRNQFRQEAVYVRMADLLEWLRQGFDAESRDDTMRARLERLREAPFLAIDEFDKVRDTPFAQEIRFHLLDDRYRRGLEGTLRCLTMIGMNASPDELPEAISSRMRDGRFICVENHQGDARPIMEW